MGPGDDAAGYVEGEYAMKSLGKLAVTGAALLFLSGCGLQHYAEEPHPWPSEKRLLAKDWVVPQVAVEEEPIYCYRTLGKVDCHGDPLGKDAEGRIFGEQPPPPEKKSFWDTIWRP